MAVQSWPVYLVTCWTASSPCLTLRRILCVALTSTTTSLIFLLSAPGLALVTGSGKNTVPTGRTGFLLSQPQCTFISRWRASLDWRGGITASTTVGSCPCLIVQRTRLSTIGDQSFRVTVARAWNSVPTSITALTSLPSFKRQLKTFLFTKSFPSV